MFSFFLRERKNSTMTSLLGKKKAVYILFLLLPDQSWVIRFSRDQCFPERAICYPLQGSWGGGRAAAASKAMGAGVTFLFVWGHAQLLPEELGGSFGAEDPTQAPHRGTVTAA